MQLIIVTDAAVGHWRTRVIVPPRRSELDQSVIPEWISRPDTHLYCGHLLCGIDETIVQLQDYSATLRPRDECWAW